MASSSTSAYLTFRFLHGKTTQIPCAQGQTVGGLKAAIEQATNIERKNIKITRNNVVVVDADSTPLKNLNLKTSDKLRILTCRPIAPAVSQASLEDSRSNISEQSSKRSKEASGSTDERTMKAAQINEASDSRSVKSGKYQANEGSVKDLTQELLKKGCKEAQKFAKIANGKRDIALLLWKKGPNKASPTYLSPKAITQILSQLVRSRVFSERKLEIMAKPELWSFLMSKIAEGNIHLREIIKKYKNIIVEVRSSFYQTEPPLSPQLQESVRSRIKKRLDGELVKQLKSKTKLLQENIETAVAIGENNSERAIEVLLNGYQKYVIQLDERPRQSQQQFFIAKWLMNLPNIKKMVLAMNLKYLEDYTLSLMHLSPLIAEIFIRNWNYTQKVMVIYREHQVHPRQT